MNKQQKQILANYETAENTSVSECYAKPSSAKVHAENEIKLEMIKELGFDYKVLSYNTNMFTCAYKTARNTLIYHTPTRKVVINLGE